MRSKSWLYLLLGLSIALFCLMLPPIVSVQPQFAVRAIESFSQSPEQQAQKLYEAGDWAGAIALLQQAAQQYQQQGEPLRAAVALSNLALVYQQSGQWQAANEVLTQSFSQIDRSPMNSDRQHVLAQTLNIQGRLQLAQGQAEAALTTWQQATELYQQLGDQIGEWQTQLNQTQALQTLGFYRRAVNALMTLRDTVKSEPSSLLEATVLRSLGDALQVTGDLTQAKQVLDQAQQTLLQLNAADQPIREAIAATDLSRANLLQTEAITQLHLSGLSPTEAIASLTATAPTDLTAVVLQQRQQAVAQTFVQQTEAAIQLYQQATQTEKQSTQTQAKLNLLQAQIDLQHWTAAEALAIELQQQVDTLPIDQASIAQRLNLAISWLKLKQATDHLASDQVAPILQLLKTALQQAVDLNDRRTQSFAWGSLGEFWTVTKQSEAAQSEATQAIQQALILSQSISATDLTYRWQWQLGRLLQQQNRRNEAIAAYTEAVKSLQALRNDLVSINRNVQFSFQAQVEPVYRELVSLLLPTDRPVPIDHLVQARQVIEGLQVAELDNFFREACLETQFQIDRVVDRTHIPAAIFYTIVLPDRLEVILKLPQQELFHYTTRINQSTIEATVDELLVELKRPYVSQRGQVLSQQVYDWLIRPAESKLNPQQIQTLVFVLDGSFRSLPIAALSDGEQYLMQKYSVALAPGLQITDPNPLEERFNVLLAGLSEARANFSPLNYVRQEVNEIQAKLPSKVLLNQDFTEANLQKQLDQTSFSIVHIATHGQFSSNAADTFILAWDQPINVNQLSNLLQAEEINSPKPIELLVLSACRTAVGDRRAALGMAGVAVRAGARSTIASLWNVDDNSGAVLMNQFYQMLVQHPGSKAEALRQAQQTLLANPQYAAPRFWAPYILLGNWL